MPVVLGYWNVRGISEAIRYLLQYSGVEYEDRKYDLSDKNEWFKVKHTLGLEFPNLPYYIDDDIKLTQTLCILRYLAKKHDLAGRTESETTTLDLLEQTAVDLLVNLNKMSYRPDFDEVVIPYLDVLSEKLDKFSKYLGDKKYLLGDRITYVDFYLYEAIDHNRMVKESCLDKFENLKDYMDRIKTLPSIAKYLSSKEFREWPVYAPHAKFGGSGSHPMFK